MMARESLLSTNTERRKGVKMTDKEAAGSSAGKWARWPWLAALLGGALTGLVLWGQTGRTAAGEEKVLRWGGDGAGGAPYIYGPPNARVGFEVDLANYLGVELGRTPRFVQGDWDALPDTLARGNIDIVLNGYEYLPSREEKFPSTVPYFVYTLRLVVRRDDQTITSWDDLKARDGRPGKRVGVLRGSVAERYLRAKFGRAIELIPTREVDETFQLVEGGERLDATVQDSPSAAYFVQGGRLPRLRVVGAALAPGYYVILTRQEDGALRQQLNEALRKAWRSGKLKEIYQKYGLWAPEQEQLGQLMAGPWPPPPGTGPAETRLTLRGLGWDIARAAAMTVALACCAMPLAILLGILVAVGRLYGPWLVRAPLALYVEVLRGTPLLLQLYVLFYLLPALAKGIGWQPLVALTTLPPFVVGVLGLAINYSAYEAENYRAGLLAIPRGQLEAALSLGMSRLTALRRIILPQAVRLVIPPVTNDFIALFKDTSICSVILITDLTGLYYQYKYDRDLAVRLALLVGLLYLLMSYPLSLLARRLEKRAQRVAA
jgi:polar amino acid transport system substrate-binding protein